jgi:adenine phosphoribosyltransferase
VPENTTNDILARAEALIREIPDYPTPGILFRDITGLCQVL